MAIIIVERRKRLPCIAVGQTRCPVQVDAGRVHLPMVVDPNFARLDGVRSRKSLRIAVEGAEDRLKPQEQTEAEAKAKAAVSTAPAFLSPVSVGQQHCATTTSDLRDSCRILPACAPCWLEAIGRQAQRPLSNTSQCDSAHTFFPHRFSLPPWWRIRVRGVPWS